MTKLTGKKRENIEKNEISFFILAKKFDAFL